MGMERRVRDESVAIVVLKKFLGFSIHTMYTSAGRWEPFPIRPTLGFCVESQRCSVRSTCSTRWLTKKRAEEGRECSLGTDGAGMKRNEPIILDSSLRFYLFLCRCAACWFFSSTISPHPEMRSSSRDSSQLLTRFALRLLINESAVADPP